MKKTFHPANIKKKFCFNITMINLSLGSLRLIAQNRNIRDYENNLKRI